MAERATIARPYAKAAFAYARGANAFAPWSQGLATAAEIVADPGGHEIPSRRGARRHPYRQVPGRVATGGQVVAQVRLWRHGYLRGHDQFHRPGGRFGPAAHGERQHRHLARFGQRDPDGGEVHRHRQVPGRSRPLRVQPVARVHRLHRKGRLGGTDRLGGLVPPKGGLGG